MRTHQKGVTVETQVMVTHGEYRYLRRGLLGGVLSVILAKTGSAGMMYIILTPHDWMAYRR